MAVLVASQAAAQDRSSNDDADIIVEGRARQLYRTTLTTVGKSAQDPLDIPQALQVINSDLFTDQGARDATDLYRNISGVSAYSYAGVTFRGFRQDESFYDGMRGNPFVQLGHYLVVRHQFPTIGGIDALLEKGDQIGFAFGNPPDRLCSEIGAATSLRGSDLIDQV